MVGTGTRSSGISANIIPNQNTSGSSGNKKKVNATSKRIQLGEDITNGNLKGVLAYRSGDKSDRFIKQDFISPVTSGGHRLLELAIIVAVKNGIITKTNRGKTYTNSGAILKYVLDDLTYHNNHSRTPVILFRTEANAIMHVAMGHAKDSDTRIDLIKLLKRYKVMDLSSRMKKIHMWKQKLHNGSIINAHGTPINVVHLHGNHNTANRLRGMLGHPLPGHHTYKKSHYNNRNNGPVPTVQNPNVRNLTQMIGQVGISSNRSSVVSQRHRQKNIKNTATSRQRKNVSPVENVLMSTKVTGHKNPRLNGQNQGPQNNNTKSVASVTMTNSQSKANMTPRQILNGLESEVHTITNRNTLSNIRKEILSLRLFTQNNTNLENKRKTVLQLVKNKLR